MRNCYILLIFIGFTIKANAQEFPVYPNGFIYSEETMSKLSHIADSLNQQFRSCNQYKEFYGCQQSIAHKIVITGISAKAAYKDIKLNIAFETFEKKYPDAEIEKSVLVLRDKVKDDKGNIAVEFTYFNPFAYYDYFTISMEGQSFYTDDLNNRWVCNLNDENLEAFYFPNKFSSPKLPQKYAKMLAYAECMTDSSSSKFKNNLKNGRLHMPDEWEKLSLSDKKNLLDSMRETRVIGYCSMDNSPRIHAVNIALLSAETAQWEVFLKAHLDIMNDRFDRNSDGSYAWAQRQTYIGELEALNIDVPELMCGLTLRVENPSKNHYYGSIGRIGRALAETEYPEKIDEIFLKAIQDKELDDYNRMLAFCSYYGFANNSEGWVKNIRINKLNKAAETLPEYFRKLIPKEKE